MSDVADVLDGVVSIDVADLADLEGGVDERLSVDLI